MIELKNNMHLLIRQAEKTDAKELIAFLNTVGGESDNLLFGANGFDMTLEQEEKYLEDMRNSPTSALLVGEVKGKIVCVGNVSTMTRERIAHHASIGLSVLRDFWGLGIGTHLMNEIIRFAKETKKIEILHLGVRADNVNAINIYKKLGFRQIGVFPKYFKIDGQYHDEVLMNLYLKDEHEVLGEIQYYNGLPCEFNGFIQVPELTNGEIYLVCLEKTPANPERKYVPAYDFAICHAGEKIGGINLRIGYEDGLYYGGHIGYDIIEPMRGRGYAGEACKLVLPVARAHKMRKLLITNDIHNVASKRVCEKLGARLVRCAKIPSWHSLYALGRSHSNIFELEI